MNETETMETKLKMSPLTQINPIIHTFNTPVTATIGHTSPNYI